MSYVMTPGWPKVLPDDDGIRPAGRPDQCYYCRSRVGEPHMVSCVCVTSLIRYNVYMNLGPVREVGPKDLVGTWDHHDPFHWTEHDCEFHKNESSWCANNALDEIKWFNQEDLDWLETWIEVMGTCACDPLEFEFDGVLNPGPFVERPRPRRVKEEVVFIPYDGRSLLDETDPYVFTGGATAMRKSVWDAMTKEQQDAHFREASAVDWQVNFPDGTIIKGRDYPKDGA